MTSRAVDCEPFSDLVDARSGKARCLFRDMTVVGIETVGEGESRAGVSSEAEAEGKGLGLALRALSLDLVLRGLSIDVALRELSACGGAKLAVTFELEGPGELDMGASSET